MVQLTSHISSRSVVYANFAVSYPLSYALNRITSLRLQNSHPSPLLLWCTYRDPESEMFALNATHNEQTHIIFSTATWWKVKGKEREEWFGNEIHRNGSDIMKAAVLSSILITDMSMLGKTHGKLWRIWNYGHPIKWMIYYDALGDSCSV